VGNVQKFLLTGGGRICCLRCTAKSTRTKLQCRKPALKVSSTQKCEFHGGRPHSTITLLKMAQANTIHGEYSKAARQQFSDDSVLMHELEDAVYVLGMAQGPRTRGRKPNGYQGVYSEDDVRRLLRDRVLHNM
jgi:hypothetical protein